MTTYRSESRGFVYTAPPSGDEENRSRPKFDDAEETAGSDAAEDASEEETTVEAERGSPTLEPMSATTDANWTGNVPADD